MFNWNSHDGVQFLGNLEENWGTLKSIFPVGEFSNNGVGFSDGT